MSTWEHRTGALQVPGKLLPQGPHQAMRKIFGVGVGVGVGVCGCGCGCIGVWNKLNDRHYDES